MSLGLGTLKDIAWEALAAVIKEISPPLPDQNIMGPTTLQAASPPSLAASLPELSSMWRNEYLGSLPNLPVLGFSPNGHGGHGEVPDRG